MSIEIINLAIAKGAVLYPNISGGKDGQAMVKVLINWKLPITGLVHADLGRTEWIQSMGICQRQAYEAGVPLHVVKRSDGRDMIDRWQHRLEQLRGTGKPFWSSSNSRYCTSDMKRDPIDTFYRNTDNNFIISCEGIRAQESKNRAKKIPLSIRTRVTSKFYRGMTVEQAIANYRPDKRLALTWYPIFNFTTEEVWNTHGVKSIDLIQAQESYARDGKIPEWWPFHPAYVFGNERVSCVFCVLGCSNDLKVGAQHRPELLKTMIEMEEDGRAAFQNGFALKELLPTI